MTNKPSFAMTGRDYLLYAGLIWAWSTSWYAIKLQLGAVSPEVSVFWRFVLTAPLMFLLARLRGETIGLPRRTHLTLAVTGVLMFSTNFIMFYYAGERLPSGFLAVIFSLASIVNITIGILFFGDVFRPKLAAGAALGVAGLILLFWPQLTGGAAATSAAGLAFGACGTVLFSFGNQISARLQRSGVTVFVGAAWGMVYGMIWAGLLSLVRGQSFAVPLTLTYAASMVFLVLSATVLAFYTFLSLVGRIGPARASYASVIFPIFALLISTALEGYHWSPLAFIGVGCALLGNYLVLKRD